ncbi:arylsulfatase [Croceicoccus estronivorus]|uniref:arylsulfatase n=1 Tax=Croceicoccus estronivorus TaxID=1172626 RepID=UPI000833A67B|nr:arylsulfatase [Croceicoccus estronivorus]OCC23438.1 arylsulfatase [Croceicoccus estronivorus]
MFLKKRMFRAFVCGVAVTGAGVGSAAAGTGVQPTGPAIPLQEEPFAGKIGKTYRDSESAFPSQRTAPAGAPNILLVLTDDVGFGAAGTFGGAVPTPNLDRLASHGLVYSRFHTTAMCSPTRASLLTGRNHHAVGNGIVANLATGFPGYDNLLPKSAATVAEVLRTYGYNTAMFGKHHNAPESHVSPAGPFDLWPVGLGFDYFYGFMAAETNQYTPALYRGITPTPTLKEGVLDKALADDAIGWIHAQQAAAPDKPFFIYYATGSTHAPLQAPADWIARFKGQFDNGWDAVRAQTVTRQKAMGILPADAQVTPRPEGLPAWDSLTADQQRVTARMMEVYAGMLAYQDAQFGRLMDELERMGELDNTLIVFIEGDNGPAAEGGPFGSMNPMSNFANGTKETLADMTAALDDFGGPNTVGNIADAWAWAMAAPNPYVKQYASHLGGVRNGMVISWPEHIKGRGERKQFAHVTDIMPTLLEAAGIEAPSSVNGVVQQPIDGTSLFYTFENGKADGRHETQYFEMMGNRAIYKDGWWAGTTPARSPWKTVAASVGHPDTYPWELYDLKKDPAQAHDLAHEQPQKLAELKAAFDREAKANQVYPLDDRLDISRFAEAANFGRQRDHYVFWGSGVSIPDASAPKINGRSFVIRANIDVPDDVTSGAIVAFGSKFGGWSFHLDQGRPTVLLRASQLSRDRSTVAAASTIGKGSHELEFEFQKDSGFNAGGMMIIRADGKEIGRGRLPRTISKLPEMTDTFDVGFDADTPVDEGVGSQQFGGKIDKVDVTLAPIGTR